MNTHSTRDMLAGILDLLHSRGPKSNGEVNYFFRLPFWMTF